jgi:hypothetical protein
VAACGRPSIDDRDIPCPEGRCPPDFVCGWDEWCYREGQAPANFAGSYSTTMTLGPNGCMFESWTEGNVSEDVPLTVTQTDTTVTVVVGGLIGGFLSLALGTNQLSGTVDGNTVHLSFVGTNVVTNQTTMCTYRMTATGDAFLQGDLIDGDLDFTATMPSCPELEGCHSYVSVTGLRPAE